MTRLVTLDLSSIDRYVSLELSDPDLETLTRNLTELTELLLDGVILSGQAKRWGRTLSSCLPKLQLLSLSYCGVSGPLDSSLLKLRSLSVLHHDFNDISTQVLKLLGKFHNLTSLHLSNCGLYGKFPERILQLPKLQSLDLSGNDRLQGFLPEFSKNGLLDELVLGDTNFTGQLPNSIGNLRFLSRLGLGNCRFNGSIPTSFSKLNQVEYLDLSNNSFTGSIISINSFEKLIYVDLSHNHLTGPIPSEWNKRLKLAHLDLANNLLNGTIPMDLLTLHSLKELQLSMNQFTGQLGEFYNGSSSQLENLDLSNNQLQGLIPMSIFEKPKYLIFSSNNFSGVTDSNLVTNLSTLSISGNQFTEIPIFLKYQPQLSLLDLSNNQIHGKIPNWIWKIGNGGLNFLNLSQNFLEDPDQPWPLNSFESMDVLDLHSNKLQGNNPIIPSSYVITVLDYSFNNLTTMILNISSLPHISDFLVLSFSNNQISGDISTWVCGAQNLDALDLSYNNFSGPIPSCLGSVSPLQVLNLRGNNFRGTIPETLFPQGCSLMTLVLSNNKLKGRLPKSIANCTELDVIDVGNNQLTDTFPSWLLSMPQLRVLVLGQTTFMCNSSMLQIFDISSNEFSGILPRDCFSSWNAMMVNKEERKWNHKDQILQDQMVNNQIYQPRVTVTSKGVDVQLVKILTIFTSIDFSNNRFQGEIPEIIGSLTSLHTLNFSDNAFTGKIPSTFGNLTHLESLDLSRNKLTGKIPFQLAGLSSLSVLNLSFNKLVGEIPSGSQFQTFDSSSFQGNIGLCGFPLSEDCNKTVHSPPNAKDGNASGCEDEFDWVLFVVTFLGFVVGAGMVIGPQYFWKKGRQWANKCINKILRIHY
ncbi:hypothetical protein MKW92_048813 [Papaver armeniacum]|nr:hypothetical protein MKW92_048813 [Papaver armeniacum]